MFIYLIFNIIIIDQIKTVLIKKSLRYADQIETVIIFSELII